MSGHCNFKELVAKMSPERQARIKVEADELANLNDSFPNGKFNWCRWSAESVEGVSAIRALLDSFHLVGKRIANVWTESYDFFNTKEEIEEEVFSDLVDRLGFTEESARVGSSIHALDERAEIPRRMEIDKPFVIEFDTRETFEMDVEIAPTYRISMNKIPVRLLKGKYDNVDPGVMFSPVVGRTITAVELKTMPEGGQEDSVRAVVFRLDNGMSLELEGFFDYLYVGLFDCNGKPCTGAIALLKKGFFNYEDLHDDPSTGFKAKEALLWFGWKGAQKLGEYGVCLTPVLYESPNRSPESARVDIRDAPGLVMGLWTVRPEAFANACPIELSHAEWQAVLDAADSFLSGGRLATGDSPLAWLLLESQPLPWDNPSDPDSCKTARLRKRDRLRLCISEIRRWAEKVIPAGGGIRIEL